MLKKILAACICISLIFEQSGFAQVSPVGYTPAFSTPDTFHPVQLRSLSFDAPNNRMGIILDKGDLKQVAPAAMHNEAARLMVYFKTGLALPNGMFWVNLRPDSPDQIIDPYLERTEVGRILLEADVQLKKDLASLTHPDTPTGRQYWNKLYARAEEMFGRTDLVVPTVTRPWIVPGQIIVGESPAGAYIYKAQLKVMLESDYLKDPAFAAPSDARLKALNDYSSSLIRKLILPQLTRQVNASRTYAPLRQVFYALVLAQWFKAKFASAAPAGITGQPSASGLPALARSIDTKDLSGLESRTAWSRMDYFKAYSASFSQGEYRKQETIRSGSGSGAGLSVRTYFSGGVVGQAAAAQMTVVQSPALEAPDDNAVALVLDEAGLHSGRILEPERSVAQDDESADNDGGSRVRQAVNNAIWSLRAKVSALDQSIAQKAHPLKILAQNVGLWSDVLFKIGAEDFARYLRVVGAHDMNEAFLENLNEAVKLLLELQSVSPETIEKIESQMGIDLLFTSGLEKLQAVTRVMLNYRDRIEPELPYLKRASHIVSEMITDLQLLDDVKEPRERLPYVYIGEQSMLVVKAVEMLKQGLSEEEVRQRLEIFLREYLATFKDLPAVSMGMELEVFSEFVDGSIPFVRRTAENILDLLFVNKGGDGYIEYAFSPSRSAQAQIAQLEYLRSLGLIPDNGNFPVHISIGLPQGTQLPPAAFSEQIYLIANLLGLVYSPVERFEAPEANVHNNFGEVIRFHASGDAMSENEQARLEMRVFMFQSTGEDAQVAQEQQERFKALLSMADRLGLLLAAGVSAQEGDRQTRGTREEMAKAWSAFRAELDLILQKYGRNANQLEMIRSSQQWKKILLPFKTAKPEAMRELQGLLDRTAARLEEIMEQRERLNREWLENYEAKQRNDSRALRGRSKDVLAALQSGVRDPMVRAPVQLFENTEMRVLEERSMEQEWNPNHSIGSWPDFSYRSRRDIRPLFLQDHLEDSPGRFHLPALDTRRVRDVLRGLSGRIRLPDLGWLKDADVHPLIRLMAWLGDIKLSLFEPQVPFMIRSSGVSEDVIAFDTGTSHGNFRIGDPEGSDGGSRVRQAVNSAISELRVKVAELERSVAQRVHPLKILAQSVGLWSDVLFKVGASDFGTYLNLVGTDTINAAFLENLDEAVSMLLALKEVPPEVIDKLKSDLALDVNFMDKEGLEKLQTVTHVMLNYRDRIAPEMPVLRAASELVGRLMIDAYYPEQAGAPAGANYIYQGERAMLVIMAVEMLKEGRSAEQVSAELKAYLDAYLRESAGMPAISMGMELEVFPEFVDGNIPFVRSVAREILGLLNVGKGGDGYIEYAFSPSRSARAQIMQLRYLRTLGLIPDNGNFPVHISIGLPQGTKERVGDYNHQARLIANLLGMIFSPVERFEKPEANIHNDFSSVMRSHDAGDEAAENRQSRLEMRVFMFQTREDDAGRLEAQARFEELLEAVEKLALMLSASAAQSAVTPDLNGVHEELAAAWTEFRKELGRVLRRYRMNVEKFEQISSSTEWKRDLLPIKVNNPEAAAELRGLLDRTLDRIRGIAESRERLNREWLEEYERQQQKQREALRARKELLMAQLDDMLQGLPDIDISSLRLPPIDTLSNTSHGAFSDMVQTFFARTDEMSGRRLSNNWSDLIRRETIPFSSSGMSQQVWSNFRDLIRPSVSSSHTGGLERWLSNATFPLLTPTQLTFLRAIYRLRLQRLLPLFRLVGAGGFLDRVETLGSIVNLDDFFARPDSARLHPLVRLMLWLNRRGDRLNSLYSGLVGRVSGAAVAVDSGTAHGGQDGPDGGRLKRIGTQEEEDLTHLHGRFEIKARHKSDMGSGPYRIKLISWSSADMPRTPAYHFKSSDGTYIVVVSNIYSTRRTGESEIITEAFYHERREIYWEQQGFDGQQAHRIAAAEEVTNFSAKGEPTPFHRSQIMSMNQEELNAFIGEDRGENYAFLERVKGDGVSIGVDVESLRAYDARLKQFAAERLEKMRAGLVDALGSGIEVKTNRLGSPEMADRSAGRDEDDTEALWVYQALSERAWALSHLLDKKDSLHAVYAADKRFSPAMMGDVFARNPVLWEKWDAMIRRQKGLSADAVIGMDDRIIAALEDLGSLQFVASLFKASEAWLARQIGNSDNPEIKAAWDELSKKRRVAVRKVTAEGSRRDEEPRSGPADSGGIDFRNLPAAAGKADLEALIAGAGIDAAGVDVAAELRQMREMIGQGHMPTAEKVKECLVACALRPECAGYKQQLRACMLRVMRLQEENAIETPREIVLALVL
ncbi:MAG TPA: hypothetical protein P5110_01130 [Candidatus Omnitrophota bacterium]|nr:hypothetical protein [Candidatus Omnitrophota bacterium]HRZ14088.1 hypothetical protein [Candidatus Omnitrophota bacterium]